MEFLLRADRELKELLAITSSNLFSNSLDAFTRQAITVFGLVLRVETIFCRVIEALRFRLAWLSHPAQPHASCMLIHSQITGPRSDHTFMIHFRTPARHRNPFMVPIIFSTLVP